MLKIVAIVSGLLGGFVLAAHSQSDPSLSLSHLSPGVAISGSDLFYDVQVPGVGGVKVTGTQFLSWVFGNVSGNCTSSISGVFSCTGGNATGIAAGTNISTSGSTVNVTVNTTLTPTFTTITTTRESNTGWLTASGVNMQTATIAGILNGSTEILTGNLTGTTGNFTGNLTSTSNQVVGFLTASGASFQSLTVAGNLTGSTGSFTNSLTAANAQVSGFLTASGANFTSATVFGISGLTQCVQANSIGLLSGTGSPCSAPTTSIAAGSNISTSGTASNVTVNVINNPLFTSITATIASVTGWLTASGVNMQTATIAGNLTGSTANFSSNLTANIAQFPGFLSAGGASLSGLSIATSTYSGNLTGTTAAFSSFVTDQIAQVPGWLTAAGANVNTLTIGGAIVSKVRSSSSSAVTASATTDYFFCLDPTSNAITLTLPGTPLTGLTYLVKDCTGKAGTNSIVITGTNANIDNAGSYVMTTNFGSIGLTYTGTQWSVN